MSQINYVIDDKMYLVTEGSSLKKINTSFKNSFNLILSKWTKNSQKTVKIIHIT